MSRVLNWPRLTRRDGRVGPDAVTVVSGLPRSGTSLMMRMLKAGGMEVLTDEIRQPDADNPTGYYEYERVKKLPEGDYAWLFEARGRAVKVISELLRWLPADYNYRVLFMRRDMQEVLASQRAMLEHRGQVASQGNDARLGELFQRHLAEIERWLHDQPKLDVLHVSYNELLSNPTPHLVTINEFLGGSLDLSAMADVIDSRLYRNRVRS